MISGKNSSFRLLILLSILMPVAGMAADSATASSMLKNILLGFSKLDSSTVAFSEEKFLSSHKKSIRLQGVLHYRKPDYLKKRIDEPFEEVLEVKDDYLSLTTHDGFTQTASLDENPEIHLYVYAFRGFLSGNHALLEKNFSTSLEGDIKKWRVKFVPLRNDAGGGLRSVVFEGSRTDIEKITITNQEDKSILYLHGYK